MQRTKGAGIERVGGRITARDNDGLRIEQVVEEASRRVASLPYGEDFVQEAFIKVFGTARRQGFDDSGGAAAYLATAARNLAIDSYRREKSFRSKVDELRVLTAATDERTPETLLLGVEIGVEILARIAALDEKRRDVLLLHIVDDLNFSSIATELGYTRSSNQPGIFYKQALEVLRQSFGGSGRPSRRHKNQHRDAIVRDGDLANRLVMLDLSTGLPPVELAQLEWPADQLRRALCLDPPQEPEIRRAAIRVLTALTTRCSFHVDDVPSKREHEAGCNWELHHCVPFARRELQDHFSASLGAVDLISRAERFSLVWRAAAAELPDGDVRLAATLAEEALALAPTVHRAATPRMLRWIRSNKLLQAFDLPRRVELLEDLVRITPVTHQNYWRHPALELIETYLDLGAGALAECATEELEKLDQHWLRHANAAVNVSRKRRTSCLRGRVAAVNGDWDVALGYFQYALTLGYVGERRPRMIELAWAAVCAAKAKRVEQARMFTTFAIDSIESVSAESWWTFIEWASIPLAEALQILGQDAESLVYARKAVQSDDRVLVVRGHALAAWALRRLSLPGADDHATKARQLAAELSYPLSEMLAY